MSGTPLRLLLVEDSPDDAALIELTLARGGYAPRIERVCTALAMSDALDREAWDVVLSDYDMPSFDAPSALALLQAHGLDIPFIIVSGAISDHAAVTSMKSGAHDYLNKANLKRLAPAIARELQEARRRAEHRRAATELRAAEARFRELFERLIRRVAADAVELDAALADVAGLAGGDASAIVQRVRGRIVELAEFARTLDS